MPAARLHGYPHGGAASGHEGDVELGTAGEQQACVNELLAAERPFIEHFDYADTWGHAVVRLTGGKIAADIYRGFDPKSWKTADFGALLS